MTNEELVRDYLDTLDNNEISNSVHLIDLNFERDSYSDILDAIYSLYLDVAETSRTIVNNEDEISNIDEFNKKSQVLDKILGYRPLHEDLTKFINNKNKNSIKKAS